MVDEGHDSEDFLLGRLNDAASGDTALRQLRRRYDLLRHDYEDLLDRLGELETRLDESAKAKPIDDRTISVTIAEAIAAPLLRLRDDYLAAVSGLQGVVTGLEGLASGFKGQHVSPHTTDTAPAARPATTESAAAEEGREARGPIRKMQVDVKGSGFGELLDFQERLSEMNGVSRVSISAIDSDRATLVVELDQQ